MSLTLERRSGQKQKYQSVLIADIQLQRLSARPPIPCFYSGTQGKVHTSFPVNGESLIAAKQNPVEVRPEYTFYGMGVHHCLR
jgi:hypothetical protein